MLALVHSPDEYCIPAWCRNKHTCLINKSINDALCTTTGCLHPTKTDNLLVLAGTEPVELQQIAVVP